MMDVGKLGKAFVEKVISEDVRFLKAIWHLPKKGNELNLAVLMDDTEEGYGEEVLARVKMRSVEMIKELMKRGIDFVVHFHLLTDYWEKVRHGNPVTIMEIKESIPVYDPSGFFIPIKRLIEAGRIPGTKEALRHMLDSSPRRLHSIRDRHYIDIIAMLFESVVDAGQSLLMLKGVSPPVPKKVADKLEKHTGLERKYIEDIREIVSFWKAIEHGEKRVADIRARDIDRLMKKAFQVIERIEELMEEEGEE